MSGERAERARRRLASGWPGDTGKNSKPRSLLIIDDDPLVRLWLARALGADVVTVVASVHEAIRAIDVHRFDAILCDVMMPDLTGADLYRILEERHPDVLSRIVFMSGGVFTPAVASFVEQVPNICLKKPFAHAELERAFEQVTRRHESSALDSIEDCASQSCG